MNRMRVKREGDGEENRESKKEMEGEKEKEHFVSSPEADL